MFHCLSTVYDMTCSCWNIREKSGYRDMIPDPRSTLSTWATDLLSAGRIVFDRDEAMREIGVGHGAFLDAAERLHGGFSIRGRERWP